MKKGTVTTIILLAVLCLSFEKAEAYPVTIYIEAEVDTVDDTGNYLEGKISPGDIITGYYTYESTTADTNPSVNVGDYEHYISPYGIFLSVGGFNFQTDLTSVNFLVELVNNNAGLDAYLLLSYNNLALSNGTLLDIISWQLDDSTEIALSSDALPTNAPILADWQFNHLRIEGEKSNLFNINAHVTSAVPEPATIVLFCIGALFLKKRG